MNEPKTPVDTIANLVNLAVRFPESTAQILVAAELAYCLTRIETRLAELTLASGVRD